MKLVLVLAYQRLLPQLRDWLTVVSRLVLVDLYA
jgi:hypothetical protein